jgi:hypothetical protein
MYSKIIEKNEILKDYDSWALELKKNFILNLNI